MLVEEVEVRVIVVADEAEQQSQHCRLQAS